MMEGPTRTKETKTAEELSAMILQDLLNMDGCPQDGVSVTVHGIPWKAVLTFGVAAGPVRNKAELQRFFAASRAAVKPADAFSALPLSSSAEMAFLDFL